MHVFSRIGVALLLAPLLLPAATLEKLSLEEMGRKATAIVRARVLSSYGAQHGPLIYTHYRVQVWETWKGTVPSGLEVVVPGGAVRGLRQTFSGAPVLAPNTEYVLFLWTGANGLTRVIGLTQGMFMVTRGPNGEPMAYRPAATDAIFDRASGRMVRDEPLTLRMRELRQRVAASAAAEGRR
ncbi:MAG: hypothetical protein ACM3S5_12315 [Rhodospirillales bacterium]